MTERLRSGPPWDSFDGMSNDYRARLTACRSPDELFYYKDKAQYERKLLAYAEVLTSLGEDIGAVLDAGCGIGEFLRFFAPPCGYLGVDLVPELVEVAQRTHPTFAFAKANIISEEVPVHETVVLVGALGASPRPLDLLLRASRLARTYFLFDYLPTTGSAANVSWLRTLSRDVVATTLTQERLATIREDVLGTSTVLLVCKRIGYSSARLERGVSSNGVET